MFSHEHKCSREHHNWLVQPFVKDRNRMFHGNRETFFPPERCVFNPPELALRLIRASSKLVKAIASPKARQPAEITGFPPDFNSLGSLNPERTAPDSINPGNLLLENSLQITARRETIFHERSGRNRRTPTRKIAQKLKIAWRLCYQRKPFRELCPRMRTPERGQLEAY